MIFIESIAQYILILFITLKPLSQSELETWNVQQISSRTCKKLYSSVLNVIYGISLVEYIKPNFFLR